MQQIQDQSPKPEARSRFMYHPRSIMPWWSWVILGLVLAAIELATPGGFFIIFFGIAALGVGALVLSHVVAAVWIQWLLNEGLWSRVPAVGSGLGAWVVNIESWVVGC